MGNRIYTEFNEERSEINCTWDSSSGDSSLSGRGSNCGILREAGDLGGGGDEPRESELWEPESVMNESSSVSVFVSSW